jgi:hypothetical protein
MRITSRFWSAIRNKDWGTAAIDVGVVAVGILMALAVDEWRSDRQAAEEELEYLQRMHSETVTAIDSFIDRQESWLGALEVLYKVRRLILYMAPADEPLTELDCDELVYSSRLPFPHVSIPAFEELAASGAVSVIQDPVLRAAALDFTDMREQLRAEVSLWSPQMHDLPFLFPDLISIRLKPVDDPEDTDGFDLAPICEFTKMRESNKFSNAMARNVANMLDVVEGRERLLLPRLKRLHELLDADLGIEHP